jgi:hypothetical protein
MRTDLYGSDYFMLIALGYGIYRMTRVKDPFAQGILGALLLSILMRFVNSEYAWLSEHILIGLGSLGAVIYAFSKPALENAVKLNICLIAIPVVLSSLFMLFGISDYGISTYLMIVPIITFAGPVVSNNQKYHNEIGFLAVIFVIAFARFSWLFGGY